MTSQVLHVLVHIHVKVRFAEPLLLCGMGKSYIYTALHYCGYIVHDAACCYGYIFLYSTVLAETCIFTLQLWVLKLVILDNLSSISV